MLAVYIKKFLKKAKKRGVACRVVLRLEEIDSAPTAR